MAIPLVGNAFSAYCSQKIRASVQTLANEQLVRHRSKQCSQLDEYFDSTVGQRPWIPSQRSLPSLALCLISIGTVFGLELEPWMDGTKKHFPLRHVSYDFCAASAVLFFRGGSQTSKVKCGGGVYMELT